jgi:phosphate transport system permease protein
MATAASSHLGLKAARSWQERAVAGVLFLFAAVSVVTTAGILMVLLGETISFFKQVSFGQFFGDTEWTPLFAEKRFGIWPLVAGTLLTSVIAVALALPLGLLGAIYLSEVAGPRTRKVLKPSLEVLAGIPTVVYGFFALTFVTPMLQKLVPGLGGFNALSPGIVMGIMILPVIASLSEDAIYAVPASLRENAYALGSTRLSAIFKVVVPSAFSGIGAAVILGVSRAIGETMIVAIAAGQQPRLTVDPTKSVETMTTYIVQVSLGDTPTGTLEYQTIFAVGMVLFTMTLLLNIASQRLRKRVSRGA